MSNNDIFIQGEPHWKHLAHVINIILESLLSVGEGGDG